MKKWIRSLIKKYKEYPNRSAGLTIIELLISMAVGSIVLMMLMQMVVMNVTAKRYYEYENFVTNQSLLITELIRKNLNELQPHRVDDVQLLGTEYTVNFKHEYDIIYDGVSDALIKSNSSEQTDTLIYNTSTQQLTYNGSLLHSTNIVILPGSSLTVTYFDTTIDNSTCSDYTLSGADLICGDGVLEMVLVMAVDFGDNNLGDVFTFTTRIIV